MKEIFKPAPDEPADPGRVFYTITAEDVGKRVIVTTIGAIHVGDILGGRVLPINVGKRLYRVPVNEDIDHQPVTWIWDAENDDQRDARLARTLARPASHLLRERAAMTPFERAMIPPRGCGVHHAGECSEEWPHNAR